MKLPGGNDKKIFSCPIIFQIYAPWSVASTNMDDMARIGEV
jgi:hypothetical protein